jgi:hypothetical protein
MKPKEKDINPDIVKDVFEGAKRAFAPPSFVFFLYNTLMNNLFKTFSV